jgi:hypothetical protein
MIIHMIFLAFHTPIPHTQVTVILSLVASIFAIMISLFNVIVSKPNSFDHTILAEELDKRKKRLSERMNKRRHSQIEMMDAYIFH